MNILWSLNEGSVRDVLAHLPEERNLAYTSASTMLRILERKNCSKPKDGKEPYLYSVLKKQDYEEATLSHVVSKYF